MSQQQPQRSIDVDELEEIVEQLVEERVDEELGEIRDELEHEIEKLHTANEYAHDRISDVEELAKLVQTDVSRLEKMENVVRHAFRTSGGRRGAALPYGEVQAAADVGSHNTAYSLMSEIGEGCDFATDHDPAGGGRKLRINTVDWELEDAIDHLREVAAREDLK